MKNIVQTKTLSLLLALAMLLSLVPGMGLTAWAEDTLTIDDLVTAVGTSTFNYSSSDAYTVQVVEGKLMNVTPWSSHEARDLTYNSSDGKYHLKFGIFDNDWYIDIDSNNYITSFMFDNGGTYESYSGKSQYALNLSAPEATAYAGYLPAKADDATALAAKVVKFNDMDWYLIEDNSTSETEGTVTLFAKDTIGSSRFDNSKNEYSGSMVKSYLDKLTAEGGAFADVADAIVSTDLEDVTVTGAKLWLLSKDEVITTYKLSTALNKCTNDWWLRTPTTSSYVIYVNGESGSVVNAGNFYMNTYGVRPALNLDLSKVEFDSETNTFAVKPTVIEYRLWVGDVQVTSANMDDVLGDKDSGATVTFTPAATGENPTPATLTLKGATVTDYFAGVCVRYGVKDTLVINLEGDNTIGSDSDDGLYTGLETRGSLIIQGNGKLAVKGRYNGIKSDGDITIESGEITASALNSGIESGNENEITLNGGKVTAKGNTGIVGYGGVTIAGADVNAEGKNYAIFTADKDITISAGTVNATATGADTWQKALNGTVKNSIYGTGWTDSSGTEGKTAIATSTTGQDLSDYKKVIFVSHIHDFTYSANGATMTATCNGAGVCNLTDNKVSFTIIAENATYDSNTHGATVDFTAWEAAGLPPAPAVQYTGRGTTTYNSTTAPTNAGTYKASITRGKGTAANIASVDYEIAKADPTCTAPTGLTATYGQTLANVTLTNPEGNTAGTWAWADDTQSVGTPGTNTFKATFTPEDTDNYNVLEDLDVDVEVADRMITVTLDANGGTTGALWIDSFEIGASVFEVGSLIAPPTGMVEAPEGYEFDALEVNGERVELGETPEIDGLEVNVKFLWKAIKEIKSGWYEENGKKCYYKDGEKTKWYRTIDGKKYYFNSKGEMVTGWVKFNATGKWHYFKADGSEATGWFKDGADWYYSNAQGEMQNNMWIKDGGKWYYLTNSGKMAVNMSILYKGKYYKFDKNGVCLNP